MDLEAAAEKLGVHYQTAYRWVRTGILPAVKVGTEYEISPEEVDRLVAGQRRRAPAPADLEPDLDLQRAELYEALEAGDENRAQSLVNRLQAGGVPPVDLCDVLVGPALLQVRRDSGARSVSAAGVALAAGICERLVVSLASPARGRPRGLVVVGSPEGERHRLPSIMATAALRSDRWRVHHLGADVPEAEIVEFVQHVRPDLLVTAVTVAGEAVDMAERLRAATTAPVIVAEPGSLRQLLQQARRVASLEEAKPDGA